MSSTDGIESYGDDMVERDPGNLAKVGVRWFVDRRDTTSHEWLLCL